MYEGNADDEQQSKGGHSLRKRARVDYTQIEDLGPAAFKASLAAKSVVTPNPRSRKKKSATDESHDDPRGSTSSPAPARGGASIRRRNTARKSVPDIPYVAQPVNDDVRDTIMVGVPQDQQGEDQEEDESNQSSFSQDESRPSTSDGSDAVQPELRPEPTTPEPQTVPQVEKAVTLAQDADDGIEKDFVPHQPNGEAEILSKQPPLPLQPTSLDDVKESIETPAALPSERPSETVVELRPASPPAPAPASVADSLPNSVPSAVESDSELQSDKVQEPEPEIKQEPKQPQGSELASIPASDINTPARSPSPEPAQTSTAPVPVLHATKATRAMEPSPAPVLTPKPTPPTRPRRSSQPQRLRNLEKIYHMETPFATQLNLTPYLNEDVVHPGQYTEPLKDSAKDKVETTPMPTPTPTPAPAERGGELKWNARRPLKQSELYALYAQEKKKRQEKGEPPISLMEFHNECARKYKAAKAQSDGGSDQPTLTGSVQSTSNSTSQSPSKLSKLPTLITQSFDETSRSSQQPDSQQPTAAPSPIAPDDDATPDQLDGLEDKQENDAPQGTRSKPDGSADLSEVVRTPPKQYSFPKLRDASQFIDALEDYEDMDDGKLYATCAAVVESMHAIQSEYLELKKILDDEENAKRRRHNDNTIVNWENRLKMDEPAHFRRHFDDTVKGPPVFEVKGVRAPKPYIDDPVLEHQKEEDRIMAQAYGFKHNPYAAAVGRQNPEELRWEMAESRPHRKGTGKAADLAEENVIEGKRMRKPRNFSDQSKDPSRAGTPTGFTSLGRRGKRKVNYAANGDSSDFQESVQITEPEPVPEPVVRKRRGPKPRSERVVTEPEDQEEAAPDVPAEESQPETTAVEEKPKTVRKRRAAAEAPTSAPAEPDENKSKRQRTGPRAQPAMEISSSSFYSNPAATGSAQPEPGSRPSTASSEATVNTAETTESAYSLRDKRKRNFVLENDPELEPRKPKGTRNAAPDAEPKKRGPRRKNAATSAPSEPSQPPPPIAPQPVGGLKAPNVFYSNAGGPPTIAPAPPGPFMHTFNAAPAFPPGGIPPPPAAPPSIKKPITKIKLTNNGPGSSAPSSRAATPANIAPNPKANKGPRGGNKPAAAPLAPADPTTPKIPSFSSTTSDLADKPYAEMSKSEKMSYSMRRKLPLSPHVPALRDALTKQQVAGQTAKCKVRWRNGGTPWQTRKQRRRQPPVLLTAPTRREATEHRTRRQRAIRQTRRRRRRP